MNLYNSNILIVAPCCKVKVVKYKHGDLLTVLKELEQRITLTISVPKKGFNAGQ